MPETRCQIPDAETAPGRASGSGTGQSYRRDSQPYELAPSGSIAVVPIRMNPIGYDIDIYDLNSID